VSEGGAGLAGVLRELGLLAKDETASLVPLSGGVSSDIRGVRAADGRRYVVKRSIPKLRVAADWRAPVGRDAVEVNWLRTVQALDPALAPEVLAWSPERHLFVMPWIEAPVWKQEMAAGRVDPDFAARVGREIARIHAAAAGNAEIAAGFPGGGCFDALRIDPFLRFTAGRHPDVAARIGELIEDLAARRTTLVWGDASPKNILVGREGPVFLDAETAVIGDAAFDVAFCLTHLLLKTVWLAPHAQALMASFAALREAYLAGVGFEPRADLSRRAAALIGGLLLARVDGKSPAGYLDADQDEIVRRRAKAILGRADLDLEALPLFWRSLE
jgi:tRNA A-37 threonylcarbamoyl transferase component Bud32